jgi:predicted nucleotidyltransferase
MASLDAVTRERMNHALRVVSRLVQPVAAYLFGSRAEGRADEWSDYDLAVFVEGAERWDLPVLARFCAAIQKEAGDDIEIHVFPASAYRSPEPSSFAEYVHRHGINLIL